MFNHCVFAVSFVVLKGKKKSNRNHTECCFKSLSFDVFFPQTGFFFLSVNTVVVILSEHFKFIVIIVQLLAK